MDIIPHSRAKEKRTLLLLHFTYMLVSGIPERGKGRRRVGERGGLTSNHSFPPRTWVRSPPLALEYSLAIDNNASQDGAPLS